MLKNMKNIGEKIKRLAVVSFFLDCIGATITGFVMIADDELIIGFLIMISGVLIAIPSLLLLWGFGEIIDMLCAIERNTRGGLRRSEAQEAQIEDLRLQGLITEEEYQKMISNQK